jgi:hypothetical protein
LISPDIFIFMTRVLKGRLSACPFLMALLVLPQTVPAQQARLYSEFQRIDPFGQVVRPDRAESSREILSPAVARNAFASFHVAVSVPPGTEYAVHIAQNPDNAVKPALYRERYQRVAESWIPDTLVPVELPMQGALGADIPGRKVDVFWLDLWVGPDAPVDRVRVEVQLNVAERWIIYPLEVRISAPVVPTNVLRKLQAASGALPFRTRSSRRGGARRPPETPRHTRGRSRG